MAHGIESMSGEEGDYLRLIIHALDGLDIEFA